MNSLTRKNKVIKAVALFLVFTLLIGFVDLSSVIAVSQEDLLDYSYLSTQNQMVSEAENITISDINTEERIQNFNQNWKFNDGDDSLAYTENFNDASWQTVNIPHDYSITKNYNSSREAESGYLDGGIGWYRKTFTVPESANGKIVEINFDGVYMNSTVYINGQVLGSHPYGYTPFAFDLSEHIKFGEENIIAVKVNHQYPSSRWYSGSGIYRDVDLIIKDELSVAYNGVKISTPNLAQQKDRIVDTNIVTTVNNKSETSKDFIVKNEIFEKDSDVAISTVSSSLVTLAANSSTDIETVLGIQQPKLWGLDNPNLYIIKTQIELDGNVVDEVDSTTGFRYVDYDSNTGFSLNGERIKIKGVAMHHDNGSLGSREYKKAAERKIDILKELELI